MASIHHINVFLSEEIAAVVGKERSKLRISVEQALAKNEKVSWLEIKLRKLLPLPPHVVFLTTDGFALPPTEPLTLLSIESYVRVNLVNWAWGEQTKQIEPRNEPHSQLNLKRQALCFSALTDQSLKTKFMEINQTDNQELVKKITKSGNGEHKKLEKYKPLKAQVTRISSDQTSAGVNEEMQVIGKEKDSDIVLQREKQHALKLLEQLGSDDVEEAKDELDGTDLSNEVGNYAPLKKRRRVRKRRQRPSGPQIEIQTEDRDSIENRNYLESVAKEISTKCEDPLQMLDSISRTGSHKRFKVSNDATVDARECNKMQNANETSSAMKESKTFDNAFDSDMSLIQCHETSKSETKDKETNPIIVEELSAWKLLELRQNISTLSENKETSALSQNKEKSVLSNSEGMSTLSENKETSALSQNKEISVLSYGEGMTNFNQSNGRTFLSQCERTSVVRGATERTARVVRSLSPQNTTCT